jgi:hypothetical protein
LPRRRGREKTQNGIETAIAGTAGKSGDVEAGRKPRTGLKLDFFADVIGGDAVEAGRKPRTGLKHQAEYPKGMDTDGRGREKTQNGIETSRRIAVPSFGGMSRQGENPERD